MEGSDSRRRKSWSMPIHKITKVMKMALPNNAIISNDAKECMQDCVDEYILFITGEAAEKCKIDERRSITGEDLLSSLSSLGFENYSKALTIYLGQYRDRDTTPGTTSEHAALVPSNIDELSWLLLDMEQRKTPPLQGQSYENHDVLYSSLDNTSVPSNINELSWPFLDMEQRKSLPLQGQTYENHDVLYSSLDKEEIDPRLLHNTSATQDKAK